MSKLKYSLTSIIALSFLAFLPLKAFSGTIPFFATNNGTEDLCIKCAGPWSRCSATVLIKPGQQRVKFYSADINIFSPFGFWACETSTPIGPCTLVATTVAEVNFCLESIPVTEVDLTITNNNNLTVNFPEDCDSLTTTAHLGDDSKPAAPDRDTFSFDGTQGEEVTLRLEEDPEAGHVGVEATLILRDSIEGVSLQETTTGSLPLEIKTTLPVTGTYSILVQQHNIPLQARFRGDYLHWILL